MSGAAARTGDLREKDNKNKWKNIEWVDGENHKNNTSTSKKKQLVGSM